MGDAPVALGDEDKTLDNATHSGRVLAVPAITSDRTITLPAPVAGATFKLSMQEQQKKHKIYYRHAW